MIRGYWAGSRRLHSCTETWTNEVGKGGKTEDQQVGEFQDVRDLKEFLVDLFQSIHSLLKLEIVRGKLGLNVRLH